MRTLTTVLAITLTLVAAAPRAQAQTNHVATQATLDAAIQQHVESTASQRAAVMQALERDEVKAVAGRVGLDLRTAKTAVATLDGADLAAAAAQAQQLDAALAGGASTVVISTTTIIIALLVVILLVIAID
jgi:ferritin-like metal-binding protein YciE